MDVENIARFAIDFEKLLATNFDTSSYLIDDNVIILRKWLQDSVKLPTINSFLNRGNKLFFNDINFQQTLFYPTYLAALRIYIPFFSQIKEGVVINNYSVLDLNFVKQASKGSQGNMNIPELYKTNSSIDNFLTGHSFVVFGEYFSKRDLIEYVAYNTGAIHYTSKPGKFKKLDKIKHLSFQSGTGNEKQDGLPFYGTTFFDEEVKKNFNPAEFMLLGNRHPFPTLLILEYSSWLTATQPIEKLYLLAKEYIVKHDPRFLQRDPEFLITNPSRKYQPLHPQNISSGL